MLRDRWDRIRYGRWAGRRQLGRFTVWAEVATATMPLPNVWADFTECSVHAGVQLGGGGSLGGDPIAGVALAVELPGWLADALVLVWPGIERRDRRDAWQRLRTGYSFRPAPSSDATPTPTSREDP